MHNRLQASGGRAAGGEEHTTNMRLEDATSTAPAACMIEVMLREQYRLTARHVEI